MFTQSYSRRAKTNWVRRSYVMEKGANVAPERSKGGLQSQKGRRACQEMLFGCRFANRVSTNWVRVNLANLFPWNIIAPIQEIKENHLSLVISLSCK